MQASSGKCRVQSVQGMFSARQVEGKCSQWKRQVQGKFRQVQGKSVEGKCKASGGNAVSGESHAVLSLTLASSLSLPCSDSVIYTFGASLFKNCSDLLIHIFGAKMLHYVKTQAASQTRVLWFIHLIQVSLFYFLLAILWFIHFVKFFFLISKQLFHLLNANICYNLHRLCLDCEWRFLSWFNFIIHSLLRESS